MPRPTFPFPSYAPSYFLGHMARSLRDLPKTLADIDLVIEARDARLPLSGVNGNFEAVIKRAWGGVGAGVGQAEGTGWRGNRLSIGPKGDEGEGSGSGEERVRERIVVYTKRDLAEGRYEEPLRKAFLERAGQKVFFADTNVDKDVKHILKYAVQLAKDHSAVMNEMKILVVGMPNVGKSSLLNALRRVGVHKGKAFRISAQPGYTRKLTGTVRIHSDPDLYVYDTPGVMVPYMGKGEKGAERALKFALTTGIKTGLFEEEVVADYLLHLLHLHHYDNRSSDSIPAYQTTLGLPPGPIHTLPELLEALARRLGTLRKGGEADTDAALVYFLKAFREGKLGRMTIDELRPAPVEIAGGEGEESDAEQAGDLGEPLESHRHTGTTGISEAVQESTGISEAVQESSPDSGSSPTSPDTTQSITEPPYIPSLSSMSPSTDSDPSSSSSTSSPLCTDPSTPTSGPPIPQNSRRIDAEVSAAVRTFLLDQARKLAQTEEMSQNQERKKEIQAKKKEKEDKWKAKHPGLAAGVSGQAAGKGVGWGRGDMRMKAKAKGRGGKR